MYEEHRHTKERPRQGPPGPQVPHRGEDLEHCQVSNRLTIILSYNVFSWNYKNFDLMPRLGILLKFFLVSIASHVI